MTGNLASRQLNKIGLKILKRINELMFAFTFSEMGLGPLSIAITLLFGFGFLVSFAFTSKNMDTDGLLRVLYSKPLRKKDGTVEYRKGN